MSGAARKATVRDPLQTLPASSSFSGSALGRYCAKDRDGLMVPPAATWGNALLGALPASLWPAWRHELDRVELPLGTVLYESGRNQTHVYFPATAIVSLLTTLKDGRATEAAIVGHEGLVGVALFMGGDSMPSRAVVQHAGHGYRVGAAFIKRQFEDSAQVTHLLLRYTQALITQMAQTAICNRHHAIDEQLCRWLLFSLDRLPGNEVVMTHELIANMLGVRRGGVTEAALKLQAAGVIRYARGRIAVLDRPGLERRSCECYAVVKREYDRLCPGAPPAWSPARVDGLPR